MEDFAAGANILRRKWMKNKCPMTKIFEIYDSNSAAAYYIMSMIAGRCAGMQEDPDGEDWTKYDNIDISIVKSTKGIENGAFENHNQVGDLRWEYTVKEFADDYNSQECLLDIDDIGHEISRLPIGKSYFHYYIKAELFVEAK